MSSQSNESPRVLSPLASGHVDTVIADAALARIRASLEASSAEARLRVTALPAAVMAHVCERLQGDARWVARLLTSSAPTVAWEATATKLIELRNTLAEPLLVCIPPGLRTAAEDSLDIATFGELVLPDLVPQVIGSLLSRLDAALRGPVFDAISFLTESRVVRSGDAVLEYLLTVEQNGGDAAAAGGALHVFGLLPDFELFSRGSARVWLDRNVYASQRLADASQPVQSRITRLKLEPGTLQVPLFSFLRTRRVDGVREWAAEIACSPEFRGLAFDQWKFADAQHATELRLILESLGLPRQTADEVSGTVQLPVLDLEQSKGLKVAFKAIPAPAQLPAWKHFRFQLIAVTSEDGQPSVAWESNSYPKPTAKIPTVRRTIKKSDLDSLEEGTYFLRVEAYDEMGTVLMERRRVDPTDEKSRAENESEVFLVTRGQAETPTEPETARAVFASSLADAWMLAASRGIGTKQKGADTELPERGAMTGRWREPVGAAPKGDVYFQLESAGLEGYIVVLPGMLRRLELTLLEKPRAVSGLQLDLSDVRTISDAVVQPRADNGLLAALEADPAGKAFLAARASVFETVSSQHQSRAADTSPDGAKLRRSVIETTDLAACADEIRVYGERFVELVESLAARASASGDSDEASDERQRAVETLRQLALLDSVEVRWRRSASDPGRAFLLAPTHPVRASWHLQHALVSGALVTGWRDGSVVGRDWREIAAQLRRDVLPLNLPMVVFDARGRSYVEHVPLTSHWALYLPDRGGHEAPVDAAACRDTLRQLLGIRGRALAVEPVGPEDLAALMFDYVQQHPYVEQLRLNVFNPGDGELVAEALRRVEERRLRLGTRTAEPPALRYAVQLFGAGERLESLGRAFDALLDPDRQVGEDDEFTLTSANHLLPKLVFARNTVTEFIRSPGRFPAHLSVFYEQFGVQGRLGSVAKLRRGSYVHGLVHEPETTPESTTGRFGWFRGLRAAGSPTATGDERALDALVDVTQRLQAFAAAGEVTTPDVAPVVAVQLDQDAQALLRQAHDVSDWVLTIDRNIGLEYFDSPSSVQECGYLLDFSPEFLQADRQRLLLTTRSALELESLVRPALEHLGLSVRPGDELPVLDALRSMSGRLALRLLSSGNRVSEIGGLLLARWLLEYAGLLEDRFVIPVDAHRGWFNEATDGNSVESSKRRADLLVVGVDSARRVIDVAVIEVKWRESLTSAERINLYSGMREQADNTTKRFRQRYDLDLYGTTRADAALQAKELSTLLAFYARRAQRYGTMGPTAAEEALDFLQSLDSGYALEIRTLGVVFERKGVGAHVDEEEIGFQVHRIGQDVADELLARARGEFLRDRAVDVSSGAATSEGPLASTDALVAEATQPAPASTEVVLGVRKPDGTRRIGDRPHHRVPLQYDTSLESFRSAVAGGILRSARASRGELRITNPDLSGESTIPIRMPAASASVKSGARSGDGSVAQGRQDDGSRRTAALNAEAMGHHSDRVAERPHDATPSATRDNAHFFPTIRPRAFPDLPATIASEEANPPSPRSASSEEMLAGSAEDETGARQGLTAGTSAELFLSPKVDVLVGANELTPQHGVIGRSGSSPIALDLTGCNTISLFGVQGFGKSYTLGVIAEMATTRVSGINVLPAPLATVVFHYHKSDAYAPEMAAAVRPNEKSREVSQLLEEFRARPAGLKDVVLLSPEARVQDRRSEFPGLEVQPIKFGSGELGAEGWKFLLGAVGSDAVYVRQLVAIMRKYRQGLTLEDFRREIEFAELSPSVRRLAEDRLSLAAPYLDDTARLADLLRPGRTVIVDLRDEWVEKDEALGLFVVMLRIFSKAKHDGRDFNKLVVFDEAHKYITDSELIGQVVESIREMRHQATSVVIASQDPLSVPRAVVELTSVLLLHRMTSPQWLKHLKSAINALDQLTEAQVGALQPGEALLWAQRSTDKRYTQRPQRIKIRPRFSQHGGGTKTAVDGVTVR
jgi:hypothetical protein